MTDSGETIPVQRPRSYHGAETPRGLDSVPRSSLYEGTFGRMFRNLPPLEHDELALIDLGCSMFTDREVESGQNDDEPRVDAGDNPLIEAGYTYLGQFIDHDITFDPTSRLQRQNDPSAITNFRTPRFDLDSVYGSGPDGDPFLYEDDGVYLRTGLNADGEPDLLRVPAANAEDRRAVIPDPRNDENLIISQLHLAFVAYHNKVVDALVREDAALAEDPAELLGRAQRVVRWHYQWIVVHDFLPLIVGEDVVKDVLGACDCNPNWLATYPVWTFANDIANPEPSAVWAKPNLRFFAWRNDPFIPVEFAAAAFRFGHSMVRDDYALNNATDRALGHEEVPVFLKPGDKAADDLHGFRERPPERTIDWARFFTFPADPSAGSARPKPRVQASRLINTRLAERLAYLPHPLASRGDPAMRELLPEGTACDDIEQTFRGGDRTIAPLLATRNLLRGQALGLPSGQAVARAMGLPQSLILGRRHFEPSNRQTADNAKTESVNSAFWEATPLWYYILKEAEVFNAGKRLGPVGGRIVAEVLIGLLYGDRHSYLNVYPAWTPESGKFGAPQKGAGAPSFGITDLLKEAAG